MAPIRVRQTGGASADCRASPTANPSTRDRMACSLSFVSGAAPASSTRWLRLSRRRSRSSIKPASCSVRHVGAKLLFLPEGDRGPSRRSNASALRASTRTVPPPQTSPSVAAYGNGRSEGLMERALEDDYLSRDPSPSKRAAYIRRTMTKARDWVIR